MTWLAAAFGAGIVTLGILGLVRPSRLVGVIRGVWRSSRGPYLAFVIRIVFGLTLLLAASESRFPILFRNIGIISIVAAFASWFVGSARMHEFVFWWTGRSPKFIRGWSLAVVGMGVFLVYGSLVVI